MLPLEVVFVFVLGIWGLIGAARGFSKEIGSSIAIVLAMAVLRFFGPLSITMVNKFMGIVSPSARIPVGSTTATGADAFCATPTPEQFIYYAAVFSVIVFMGYQGQTLGLSSNVGKLSGNILGLFVGLVNGWLVAGNLWYFLDKCARYNVPKLGIQAQTAGQLSASAQTIIKFLPFNVLSEPILLIGLLFLLLILRIAK